MFKIRNVLVLVLVLVVTLSMLMGEVTVSEHKQPMDLQEQAHLVCAELAPAYAKKFSFTGVRRGKMPAVLMFADVEARWEKGELTSCTYKLPM